MSVISPKSSNDLEGKLGSPVSEGIEMEMGEEILDSNMEGEISESPLPKDINKDKKVSPDKKEGHHKRSHRDHTHSDRHHHRRHHHRRHRRSNSIEDLTDEREMTDENHETEDQGGNERLHPDTNNETTEKTVRSGSRRHHHSSKRKSSHKDKSHHGSSKELTEDGHSKPRSKSSRDSLSLDESGEAEDGEILEDGELDDDEPGEEAAEQAKTERGENCILKI